MPTNLPPTPQPPLLSPKKASMHRRAFWHDYKAPGTYMLTLVVEGRRPVFGRLEALPLPYISLSQVGHCIEDEELPKISRFYPNIEIWRYCIMPDHIHLILHVNGWGEENKHLGKVIAGFKYGCTAAFRRLTGSNAPLFEKGYNDRLLHNGEHLERWKRYLDDNPRRLLLKRQNPDLFTVLNNLQIGSFNCQMVGNQFLLDIPDKMAVIVHRRYTDEEYQRLTKQWLACGERGGVLVSSAIAPREKEVLKQARENGYNIIWLRENGFPEFYKPTGNAFDACSSGRLLQISPWEHHTEQHVISREQCLMLNRLAEEIAEG